MEFLDRRLSYSMCNHPLDEFIYATVFGSCNGVVSIRDFSRPNNVLLYNPFTDSRRILPAKGLPNHGRLLYGFGYDSKTKDYKVLRIAQDDHVCSVYSLNNDCWKSVNWIGMSRQFYFLPYPRSDGLLANENLHYLVMSTTNDYERMIVCFDLRTESFSLMDCPNHEDENNNKLMIKCNKSTYLAELDGCLCVMLMYFTQSYYPVRADLLVMKEYGNKESWSKVFSIRTKHLSSVCRSFIRIKPVVYSKDRRRILIDIDSLVTGWFDLETKKFEERKCHGQPNEYFYDRRYFVGSLVSVWHTN